MKRLTFWFEKNITTARFLFFGYVLFVLIGTVLLMLPAASSNQITVSFIDSLFTATSAISTTGLIVVDTATKFSLFGQIVILCLIQIGGVGYMLFFALAVIFIGGKLSFYNKLIIKESISSSRVDLKIFIKKIFKYTFIVESVSAVLLITFWMQSMSIGEAIWQGVFHSISAFCTAGISLFSNGLIGYQDSYYINVVISLTSLLGSVGFFVIYDFSNLLKSRFSKERYRLTIHSRVTLAVSLSIIIFVSISIFTIESFYGTEHEIKTPLESVFQSISASTTAGYNTVDIGKLERPSQLLIISEMFIGASPSGTGGGIKTTVFAIMMLSLFNFIRDRKHVTVMKGTVHPLTIARAFSISLLSLMWLFFVVFLLSFTESFEYVDILFETASALGTVGLSTGITGDLSVTGKVLITLTMLIGRVGPLVVGYTLIGKPKSINYEYPEANILIV